MNREVRFVFQLPAWFTRLRRRPGVLISLIALPVLIITFIQLYNRDPEGTKPQDESFTEVKSNTSNKKYYYESHHRLKPGEDLFDAFYTLGFSRRQMTPMIYDLEPLIDQGDLAGGLLEFHTSLASDRSGKLSFTPDPVFYEINLFYGDSSHVERKNLETLSRDQIYSHVVSYDNFYESLHRAGFERMHMQAMEDALAWSVDFHRIRADSKCRFKAVFQETHLAPDHEETTRATESLLSAKLLAIAMYLEDDEYSFYQFGDDFFDSRGNSARRQFLRAPVKYSRISSYFGQRVHPVTGQVKQHNGIDFAADEGDPIHALSDGVVQIATYKPNNRENNGNYVKIKHDHTYQTQYLHMSRLAEGIRKGTEVKQGQIIGFVGQTGLATGSHVCLRFWKNDIQVDFFRERMQHLRELPRSEMADFRRTIRTFDDRLNSIDF